MEVVSVPLEEALSGQLQQLVYDEEALVVEEQEGGEGAAVAEAADIADDVAETEAVLSDESVAGGADAGGQPGLDAAGSPKSLPYTTFGALSSHVDMAVIAKDGERFYINRAVFAAFTRWDSLLQAIDLDTAISTELDAEDLKMALTFMMSGEIRERRELSHEIAAIFSYFGFDISNLTFHRNFGNWPKLYEDEDPLAIPRPTAASRALSRKPRSKPRPAKGCWPLEGAVASSQGEESPEEFEFEVDDGKENKDDDDKFALESNAAFRTRSGRKRKVTEKMKSLTKRGRLSSALARNDSAALLDDEAIKSEFEDPKNKWLPWNVRVKSRLEQEFIHSGERNPDYKCQCDECLYGCDLPADLVQHRLRHQYSTVENELFFFCVDCDNKGFVSRKALRNHRMVNHAMNEVINCKLCDVTFSRYDKEYSTHLKKAHNIWASKPCIHCGVTAQTSSATIKHRLNKGPYHTNRCAQCPKDDLNSWREHQRHVTEVHHGIWKYMCGHCGQVFDTKSDHNKHQYAEHKVKLERTPCKICGKPVLRMERHMELHHNDNAPKYPCPNCTKPFPSEESLANHIKMMHEQKFQCEMCGKGFGREALLKDHVFALHTPDALKPFRCRFCPRGFARKSALSDHENTHTKEIVYKCGYCEKTFSRPTIWRDHENQVHKGNKRSKRPKYRLKAQNRALGLPDDHPGEITSQTTNLCVECGKKYQSWHSYKLHLINAHMPESERPNKCPQCPKGFVTPEQLKEHMNTHNNTKPYECELCSARFNTLKVLRTHTAVKHTDNHKCSHCTRHFLTLKAKEKHELIHSDETFTCHICGASYDRKLGLNIHLKRAHGEAKIS